MRVIRVYQFKNIRKLSIANGNKAMREQVRKNYPQCSHQFISLHKRIATVVEVYNLRVTSTIIRSIVSALEVPYNTS